MEGDQLSFLSVEAANEKQHAARTSVLAACGLVFFKGLIGVSTGSLGILAEAAHSGFDLVAALMTLFAVRISSKPADKDHLYGHGKFENLSALAQTLLLLFTCAWITFAAVERLVVKKIDIDVTFWSFAVMFVSIIVDVNRSRFLYRVAKKYKSQALEADALHFSSDIWSSVVVIVGLVCVAISDRLGAWGFLHYADSIAALLVAIIVMRVSLKLGLQAANCLLDAAPVGLDEKIVSEVNKVPGTVDCHHVRIRHSGAKVFIDLHVNFDGNKSLNEVHKLTEEIELAIERVIPDSDVTVHPEPK